MARIRTIKPQFWEDIKIGKLSLPARLLFIGCWSFSDDHGVILADLTWVRSNIFKYDSQISNKIIGRWLNELVSFGLLIPFEDNGEKYFIIKNFNKHQLINKPSKFCYATPPTLPEQSRNTPGTVTEQSRWDLVSSNSKKEEGSSKKEEGGECEGRKEQTKVNPLFLSSKEEDQNLKPKTYWPDETLTEEEKAKRYKDREANRWIKLKMQADELRRQGVIK
jgi:hypothetical protein